MTRPRESIFRFLLSILVVLVVPLSACAAAEPPSNRVLVVYDNSVRDSHTIAKYYAEARHIPAANICRITLSEYLVPQLTPEEYLKEVQKPVQRCLTTVGKEKILYIVLAYIRPFRVDPGSGLHGYALDSYLADIWDAYTSQAFSPVPNRLHPYYADNHAKENVFLPFVSFAVFRDKPDAPLIYSVWRLDGPTPAIARSLVDKAIKTEAAHGPMGQACIDEVIDPTTSPDEGLRTGDWDLYRAAQFLMAAGFKVVKDDGGTEFGTAPAPLKCPDTALYAGWYSYNHYNDAFTWNDGAIGFHLDSASMLDPRVGVSWSVNALQRGITVTSGATSEPYVFGLPRPSGIFHDLLAGASVGDAFLRNTRFLKWHIINVGDPLYCPFPGGFKHVK
jgi:uncharacterized protein (TIGR03790 family)